MRGAGAALIAVMASIADAIGAPAGEPNRRGGRRAIHGGRGPGSPPSRKPQRLQKSRKAACACTGACIIRVRLRIDRVHSAEVLNDGYKKRRGAVWLAGALSRKQTCGAMSCLQKHPNKNKSTTVRFEYKKRCYWIRKCQGSSHTCPRFLFNRYTLMMLSNKQNPASIWTWQGSDTLLLTGHHTTAT